MIDSSTLSSDTTNISNPIQPYQFTLRRGFLALFVMYACQTLVGLAFAYGVKFFSNDVRTLDIQMIGMSSVLVGGILVLLLAWLDIHRLGRSFVPQIGLHRSEVKTSDAIILVFLLLSTTHFFAWIYRSVFLPLVDQKEALLAVAPKCLHTSKKRVRQFGWLASWFWHSLLAL